MTLNNSFSVAPLIPVKPTGKPITFYGHTGGYFGTPKQKIRIRVGAVAKNRSHDEGDGLCPSVHIELWHLILVLLSFWEERKDIAGATVTPTFGEVWRRFTISNAKPSSSQLDSFGKLLDELDALRMGVCVGSEESETFVDVVHYETRRQKFNFGTVENTFNGFTFHERFIQCMLYADRFQDVRLDVLAGITSRHVRAAYLWLPARAVHYPHPKPAQDPGAKCPEFLGEMAVLGSAEFMQNLGEGSLPRSKRKERLLQHGAKSILAQLHGLPLLRQYQRLGVAWWDGEEDFFIGTYTFHAEDWLPGASVASRRVPRAGTQTAGKLYKNFIAGGGTPDAYWHYVANWKTVEVDPYVIERMSALGVKKIDEYLPLYKQAHAILGPDAFRDAVGNLGEASSRKPDKGFLFRGILFERVRILARSRSEHFSRSSG